ncbi:hypothetical protein [Phytoactinopolyspora endophytica]|nr:hypothetical protein [Phytoactinopolyspora endophytica]
MSAPIPESLPAAAIPHTADVVGAGGSADVRATDRAPIPELKDV